LKVVGDEIRGKCPLCGGERSFSANPVKGVFNCFRCRKNKDVIDFVKFYQKVEPKQAAEWLVSLLPPAQDVPDEQTEGENALSALSLTDREVRLLQIIARANMRCVATMFSSSFASVVEQLEDMARQIVTEEIVKEFPDTVLPEE
jgi:DNA primase